MAASAPPSSVPHADSTLHRPHPPSSQDLSRWLSRHHALLSLEASASATPSSSNTRTASAHLHTPHHLASTGQALLTLTPLHPTVGPGGKTLFRFIKSSAWHVHADLGTAHAFRNGDACCVMPTSTGSQGKGKRREEQAKVAVDAVVFRVERESITLAIGRAAEGKADEILPGSATFDLFKVQDARVTKRMQRTLESLADQLGVPVLSSASQTDAASAGQGGASFTRAKRRAEPRAPSELDPTTADQSGKQADSSDDSDEEAESPPTQSNGSNEKQGQDNVSAEIGAAKGTTTESSASTSQHLSRSATDAASNRTAPDKWPVREVRSTASPLINVLLGLEQPSFMPVEQYEKERLLGKHLYDQGLNESQRAALDFCLRAKEVALVHGPPGTGKTRMLTELILQLALAPTAPRAEAGSGARNKKRVLVCAASNLATDNVLSRVVQLGHKELKAQGLGVTRVGHPARLLPHLEAFSLDDQAESSDAGQLLRDVKAELSSTLSALHPSTDTSTSAAGNKSTSRKGQASSKSKGLKGSARKEAYEVMKELRREQKKRERGLYENVLREAAVVFATCHTAGAASLKEQAFDVLVVDEACQALEAQIWIPILSRLKPSGKLILAGDHLQLPPTVLGYKPRPRAEKRKGKRTKDVKAFEKQSEADEAPLLRQDDVGQARPDTSLQLANDPDSDEESDTQLAFQTSCLSPEAHTAASEERSGEATKSEPKRTRLRVPRSLETTMFSRLLGMYGSGMRALLDEQYRFSKTLQSFPNSALYEDALRAAPANAQITLLDLDGYGHVEGEEELLEEDVKEELWAASVVFYDTAGAEMYETSGSSEESKDDSSSTSESKSNANEIGPVLNHIKLLLKHGLAAEQITVLSPYSAQVALIGEAIRQEAANASTISTSSRSKSTAGVGEKLNVACTRTDLKRVDVGTIDSQQGRENEVVIMSLVRSNAKREVGFLKEKRRLNVAMTRAKRQLVVVADSDTVAKAGDAYLARWMQWLEENARVEVVGS
ncbi:DNA helicase [Ceraceosorus bombacis]|uniref:DNA helicase n=1 Tax=Ceraceosorus bombacis TaxID=401625 RepID=A0A0N7L8U4_9BASI|nr:DNA helicase [Ceraceosorus bombacis]